MKWSMGFQPKLFNHFWDWDRRKYVLFMLEHFAVVCWKNFPWWQQQDKFGLGREVNTVFCQECVFWLPWENSPFQVGLVYEQGSHTLHRNLTRIWQLDSSSVPFAGILVQPTSGQQCWGQLGRRNAPDWAFELGARSILCLRWAWSCATKHWLSREN